MLIEDVLLLFFPLSSSISYLWSIKFLKHPEIEDFAKKNDHIYSQSIQSPANWERVIEGIHRMRSVEHAPADSIDTDEGMNSLQPKERRFAELVGSLLSSQTKGHVTHGKCWQFQLYDAH
ncbi:hypothetical protein T459_26131 [Capsicum annuum]|uniref:Uncharacterized protein n=1 Tax=Capsicum annuum TaxID=4072 RepID=A0A2G2YMQ1_CAPAN|nr:hypothetical protein T459_26131 [Capsicum annuum]